MNKVEKVNSNDSEIKKYNGLTILSKKELPLDEYDKEDLGYCMYNVVLVDGTTLQLFEDEILK